MEVLQVPGKEPEYNLYTDGRVSNLNPSLVPDLIDLAIVDSMMDE